MIQQSRCYYFPLNRIAIGCFIWIFLLALRCSVVQSAEIHSIVWGIDDPEAIDSSKSIQEFEKLIGIDPLIVAWHENSLGTFPIERCAHVWASGHLPLILWDIEPNPEGGKTSPSSLAISLKEIVDGNCDQDFRRWAEEAVQYGEPVLIHFLRHFNRGSHPWSIAGNDRNALQVRYAFQRVVNLFRECGASNVRWVWGPDIFPSPAAGWNQWEAAYPGDAFVDFVALDSLNIHEADLISMPLSFEQLFTAPVRRLRQLTSRKPILITSLAVPEIYPSHERWLREMIDYLPRKLPDVKGVIWFNSRNGTNNHIQNDDYRLLKRFNVRTQTPRSAFLKRPSFWSSIFPITHHNLSPPSRYWRASYIETLDLSQLPSAFRQVPALYLNDTSATSLGRELIKNNRFSARVCLGWNSDALLVWCEVDDSTLGEGQLEPDKIWDGDGLELAIGNPLFQEEAPLQMDWYRLLVSPGNARQIKPVLAFIHMNDGTLIQETSGIAFQSQFGVTSHGYRIYGMIPWKIFGFEPKGGEKIPFNMSITDGIAGHRVRQLVWSGGPHAYYDPSECGYLELSFQTDLKLKYK